MKKIYCIALAMIISATSIPTASAGYLYVTGKTLKSVRSNGNNGMTIFITTETVLNPAECNLHEFYGVPTTNNPELAMAVLLSAKLGGLVIDFWIDDTYCTEDNRPLVTNVSVR